MNEESQLLNKYLSDEARKRFLLFASIIIMVFLFTNSFVPLIIKSWDPYSHKKVITIFPGITLWKNRFFYLKREFKMSEFNCEELYEMKKKGIFPEYLYTLESVNFDVSKKPIVHGAIKMKRPRLLGTKTGLWIFGIDNSFYYHNGKFTNFKTSFPPGKIGFPFTYNGRPAVVRKLEGSLLLYIFRDSQWQMVGKIALDSSKELDLKNLKVFAKGDDISLFYNTDQKLFCFLSRLNTRYTQEDWQLISNTSRNKFLVIQGENDLPMLLFFSPSDKKVLKVVTLQDGMKEEYCVIEYHYDLKEAIFLPGKNRLHVLDYRSNGRIRMSSILNKVKKQGHFWKNLRDASEESPSIDYNKVIKTILVINSILFILLISMIMFKYRNPYHSWQNKTVRFAPLWRRLIAMIIDLFIFIYPIQFINELFNNNYYNISSFFVWICLIFLLYSFTESRWGLTPGKFFTLVRVTGLNLKSFGFRRAMLRNLIKPLEEISLIFIVVSFEAPFFEIIFFVFYFYFSWIVLIIAFSEKWQRIVDMASDTIVISTAGKRKYQDIVK